MFVTTRSSFAAEVGGCQAETGAGAAMAAAALVELGGGNAQQALGAASHALQNVLGLVCDPVANRVEAPCLGRNIAGAAYRQAAYPQLPQSPDVPQIRASISLDVLVIDSPPSAVHRSSLAMFSLISRWASSTSSSGIRWS